MMLNEQGQSRCPACALDRVTRLTACACPSRNRAAHVGKLQDGNLTCAVSPKPSERCEEAQTHVGDELATHDAAPAEAAKRLSR